nr:hypothetical protein [Tanacetum cinerariifolium]
MVVVLPFTVNLYHDGIYVVNPLEYVHFDSRVIDDVSFVGFSFKDFLLLLEEHNGYDIMEMIHEDLHSKIHHNHNKLLVFYGRDVSQGKCVGLKGKKPKTIDDDECKTNKQGSKIGLWIPCVHEMVGYMHMKMNLDFEVDECQLPPLPHVERKMYGRPRKRRIRHPTEDDDHVLLREAQSSSMLHPTSTPSTSFSLNIMPPPPTPLPSTSNTMPPLSGFNTMPPPPTPPGSNTMPSHATPASNTSACSNTMPFASTGTNKGTCPLIPKKRGRLAKSSASSSRGGSRGGATSRGGSRDSATSKGSSRGRASKRGRGSSKRDRGSSNIPFQGLKDEASDEEHEFNMDMETVYEMKREKKAIYEDDQFWEECAKEFDHVEEHRAQNKDLPTQESTVEVNPKLTRSKKSKAAKVLNQMRIFNKNRGRSKRIFNQKMINYKLDEYGTGSTQDKAFDVE